MHLCHDAKRAISAQRRHEARGRSAVGARAVISVRHAGEGVTHWQKARTRKHAGNVPSGGSRGKLRRWYAVPMVSSLLLALVGCAGDDTNYTLHLNPVTVLNQAPLEDLDQVDVVLMGETGAVERFTLSAPDAGSTPSVSGLPPLEGTRVRVEGFRGGNLVMRGQTAALTVQDGLAEADVFVAETDAVAWLADLDDGLHLPVVAALGGGRFLIAGGATSNRTTGAGKATSDLRILSLAPPTEDLRVERIGEIPSYTDAKGNSQSGLMGATVTPLKVAGDHEGQILILGGSKVHPVADTGQTTATAVLFDPTSDTWEALDTEMSSPRSLHVAVENILGNVVIWGGIGQVNTRTYDIPLLAEIYSRSTGKFESVGPLAGLGFMGTASADLGTDGTLFCAGAWLDEDWSTSTVCGRVDLNGTEFASFPDVPKGVAGAAMVALEDGRVLLTGGGVSTGMFDTSTPIEATDAAWLYNPDTEQWGSLSSSMATPRAGHRMVVLADGRVLIVGGATTWSIATAPSTPLSCVELYDPLDGSFTSLNGCNSSDAGGGLQERAFEPQVAYDPDFGVLIVGGLTSEGTPGGKVSLFVPPE
jgi:hypothetical protein